MADGKTYVAQDGFVQFDDAQERDANNQKVLDFTIKCTGKPVNVRVTLWPELKDSPDLAEIGGIKKGDFVAVEGTFTQSTWQDDAGVKRTSNQINAFNLNVNGKRINRVERDEVVSSGNSGEDLPF